MAEEEEKKDEYEELKNLENGALLNYLALVDSKHDFGGDKRCLSEPEKETKKEETGRLDAKKRFDLHWKALMVDYEDILKKNTEYGEAITEINTGGARGEGFEKDFMEKAFEILSKESPHLIKGDLNLYEQDVGTHINLKEKNNFIMTSGNGDKTGLTYEEFKRFFALGTGENLQKFYTCHDSTTGSFIWKEDESAIPVDERKKHFVLLLPQNSFDGARGKSYGAEDSRKGNDNYWEGRHTVELDVINETGNKRDHWVFRSNIITQNGPTQKFIFKIKNPIDSKIKITRIKHWIYKILKKKMDYKHQFQIKKKNTDKEGKEILLCEFNGNSALLKDDKKKVVLLDFNKDSDVTFVITETCKKKFEPKKSTILDKYLVKKRKAFDGCISSMIKWYSGKSSDNTWENRMGTEDVYQQEQDLKVFYDNKGKLEAGITESGPSVGSLCAILIKRNKEYFEENIGRMCNSETLCYKLVKKLHNLRHSVKPSVSSILKSKVKVKVNGRLNWHDMTETELFNIILDLKRAGDWEQVLACKYYMEKQKNENAPERCIFFSGDCLCFLFAMLLDIDCIFTNNRDKHYFYRSSKNKPKSTENDVPGAFLQSVKVKASGGGNKISLANGKLKYNLIGGAGCSDFKLKERRVYKNEIVKTWNKSFISAVGVGLGDPNTDHYRYIHLNNPGMSQEDFEKYFDENIKLFDDKYTTLTSEERAKKFIPNIKKAKIVLIVMGLFYELLMSYTAEHNKETVFEYDRNTINHNLLKQSIFYPVVFSNEYKVNNSFEQLIGLKNIEGLESENYLLPIQTLSYCEHAFYFNLKENLKDDLEKYLGDIREVKTKEEELNDSIQKLGREENEEKNVIKKVEAYNNTCKKHINEYLNNHDHFKKIQDLSAKLLEFEKKITTKEKPMVYDDEKEVKENNESTKEAVKNLIVLRNFLYGGTIEYLKFKIRNEKIGKEVEQEKIDDISYLKKIQEINYKFYKKLLSIRNILKNNKLKDSIYSCEELQFEHIYFFTEKIHNDIGDCLEYPGTMEPVKFLNGTVIDLISGDKDKRKKFIKNIAYEFMDLLKRIRTLTLERIFFSNIKENFIEEILAGNTDIVDVEDEEERLAREAAEVKAALEAQAKVSSKIGGNKKKKKKQTKRIKMKLKKQRKRSKKKKN